jgi:hypothetical protein
MTPDDIQMMCDMNTKAPQDHSMMIVTVALVLLFTSAFFLRTIFPPIHEYKHTG